MTKTSSPQISWRNSRVTATSLRYRQAANGKVNRGLGNASGLFACSARLNFKRILSLTVTQQLVLADPRIMSEERRPRSRFEPEENERPVRSRFDTDRRSRSPSRRESDSHRARSPVAREGSDSPAAPNIKKKAAEAAAAAAARINAQIQAKKAIQHVDVPPIRAVRSTLELAPSRFTC